jgi:hypothetical protein
MGDIGTLRRLEATAADTSLPWDERERALKAIDRWHRPDLLPEKIRPLYEKSVAMNDQSADERWSLVDEGTANRRPQRGLFRSGGQRPTVGKRRVANAAVKTERGWTQLGNDLEAIRDFVSARAEDFGWDVEALIRSTPRGRLSDAESARRNVLARVVRDAVNLGAKEEAIGTVIDRPKQRVSDLVRHGERLAA